MNVDDEDELADRYASAADQNARLKAILADITAGGTLTPELAHQIGIVPSNQQERQVRIPLRRRVQPQSKGRRQQKLSLPDARSREIARSNQFLMRNLNDIHTRRPASGSHGASTASRRKPKSKSSASLNRQREQERIARENAIFAQRLQTVKGTKALTRKTMKKGAKQQKSLARNCRRQQFALA